MCMLRSKLINISGLVAVLTLLMIVQGCGPKIARISLDYNIQQKNSPTHVFDGQSLTIEQFEDARKNKFIAKNTMMNEGEEAGLWIANAIRLELEQAGAYPTAVQSNARPSSGYHLMGRVNILETKKTGWQMGGLVGALSKSGLYVHINLTTILLKDGVEFRTHTYDSAAKTKNSFARNMLVGGTNIPKSMEAALQQIIRTQIIPDLQQDMD